MPQLSVVPDQAAAGGRKGPPPFLCTLHKGGTLAAWVQVAGEVDLATSRQLERTLREAQLDTRLIVLDAREVTFIDSSGVHVIVDASATAQWGGAQLILMSGRVVDRMLELSGAHGRVRTLGLDRTDRSSELRLISEVPAA
jgi:anti-anti-sigma factor